MVHQRRNFDAYSSIFWNINYCSNFFLSQWIIGSIRKAKISTGSLYFVTDQSGLIPNHLWIKPGQCSPVILIITYDKIIDKIRAIFFLKNSTRIFLSSALFWILHFQKNFSQLQSEIYHYLMRHIKKSCSKLGYQLKKC